jgi:SAM-dependent methyltransferase
MTSTADFWEEREQVERFAAREPDLRLQRLARELPAPSAVSALDIGCAGGRNTVFLAERGCDVWGIDSSSAMVEETRARLARTLGEKEARRRVREGFMDRLDWPPCSFDLIIALGIYHCAGSREEWERSLSETARVLKPGGQCLVSVFTPETDLTGQGIRPVAVESNLYEGFPDGRLSSLVDAGTLDTEMKRHGLLPVSPTETVRRATEVGRRVSANGLYVRSR